MCCLLAICCSCSDPSGNDAPPIDIGVDALADESLGPINIHNVNVVENPNNSLSYFVEWETDVPANTHLDVVCGDEIEHRYESPELRTTHSVFVMGLLDGISCDLSVESRADNRVGRAFSGIGRAGPVPEFLTPLSASVVDTERMQPGWTLWTFGQASTSGPVYVIITDELGRYRWYNFESQSRRYSDNELQVIPEGLLLGGGSTKIISWEGDVVWEPPFYSHHDIRISPFEDNQMLYLGYSDVNCDTPEGTANEFDRITQETTWTWRICEHFTPRLNYSNWSHINTLEPYLDERAFILSVRDQNAILKVQRDTGEIEWILGENGDFDMEDEAVFLRQHAAELQPNGNILMFDNGLNYSEAVSRGDGADRTREYSRVIELELVFDGAGEPLRADLVWEYTDQSLFSGSRSEADRLENGNTLITYSWLESEGRATLLREVTHEGEIVWELLAPVDRATYRSERIEPMYGFVRDPE